MSHRCARHLARISAVAVLAISTGCATLPARTELERAADDELAVRVDRALLDDPTLYARHVDVDVSRGVVRLSGFVWSGEDLYEARHVAAGVTGVRAVVNQLELMVGGRAGAR